jgi:TatD DNase family protein
MKLGIGGWLLLKMERLINLSQIDLKHIVLKLILLIFLFLSRKNESSYLVNIQDKLVQIYEISANDIATTTENSKLVFGI